MTIMGRIIQTTYKKIEDLQMLPNDSYTKEEIKYPKTTHVSQLKLWTPASENDEGKKA